MRTFTDYFATPGWHRDEPLFDVELFDDVDETIEEDEDEA